MNKKKIRNRLLLRVLLLSTLIFTLSTASIYVIPSQNSKQEAPMVKEKKIPYTSAYESDWQDEGVLICDESGEQGDIQICSDKAGGVIITWADERRIPGSYNYDVYAQRIASNGTVMWGDDGLLICNKLAIGAPQICSDNWGGAYITWYDYRAGRPDIYVQKVDSDGKIDIDFLPNGTLICDAPDDQMYPKIKSDDEGNAIIAWQDKRNGDFDVYAQKIDHYGVTQWETNGIPVCNATGDQFAVQTCFGDESGVVIVWVDNRTGLLDIYAQRIDHNGLLKWNANGTSLCNATVVGPDFEGWFPYYDEANIDICGDDDGGAIVTWIDNRTEAYSDYDLYAQWIAENGTVMWAPNGTVVCNASNRQESVQICLVNDAVSIVAWKDDRFEDESDIIYAQKINPDGSTAWTDNGTAICTYVLGGGAKGDVQICNDGDDGFIFTWKAEGGPGYSYDIWAQKVNSDGTSVWTSSSSKAIVIHEDQSQGEPVICADGSGGAIVAWVDERNDPDGDIYAQKITDALTPSDSDDGGGGGGGGGSSEEEALSLLPFIIIGLIAAIVISGSLISYSIIKKKHVGARFGGRELAQATKTLGFGHDVFICHSSKDKKVADATCHFLEQVGIKCWIAPRDVSTGSYAESIVKAIKNAKIVVLIFTNNANFSKHVKRELEQAVKNGVTIQPFRTEDVQPSEEIDYYISSEHWLDALTPPLEEHLSKLTEMISKLLDVVSN